MQITVQQMAEAFTEWERRYRADPSEFDTVDERLDRPIEEEGNTAAAYFLELLDAVGADVPRMT